MIDRAAAYAIADALCRQVEGCVLHPYQDSGGTWTIGIGSVIIDGRPVTASTPPITIEKAEQEFNDELYQKANVVDSWAPASATPNECAALYSFTYNEGVSAFQRSRLCALWHAGNREGAAAEFANWVYVGGQRSNGLVNRRKLERSVFLGLVSMGQSQPAQSQPVAPHNSDFVLPNLPVAPPSAQPAEDEADALDKLFNPGAQL